MRKDWLKVVVGFGIILAVILTLALYMVSAGSLGPGEYIQVFIVLMLVTGAIVLITDRLKNARAGLPARDEMERKINWRAGYYGFIAAIWGAVFGPLVIDILFGYELEGSRVTALVVLVSGLTFVFSYLYLRRKGIGE